MSFRQLTLARSGCLRAKALPGKLTQTEMGDYAEIEPELTVQVGERDYAFHRLGLTFESDKRDHPPFSYLASATLGETILRPRYASLAPLMREYSGRFDEPLGSFLLTLKVRGNPLYRRFLNPYGDERFGVFELTKRSTHVLKGVYIYRLGGLVVYVGRCIDSMKKRLNQGYGRIHPKNCYLDGQSTNCRLNSLIYAQQQRIELLHCSLHSVDEIISIERDLIRQVLPAWNKQIPA